MQTTLEAGASRRALILVFLAAMIEGFDLQAAGVAAPKLGPAFGLLPNQMGLFFAAATFGLMFGALAGGIIADRLGRRAGLALSLAIFGIFSIATSYAGSFETLVVMRFLTGLGLGGALPNLVSIAAESVAPERRGRSVAIMYAGTPLGGALASFVAMLGLNETWQLIFLIGGILPLLLVVPILLLLPAFRVTHDAAVPTSRWQALFAPRTMASTFLLWAAFFFGMVIVYLMLNWLPQLLVSLGFARDQASQVQIVFNIGGAIGSVISGWLLDSDRPAPAAVAWFTVLIVAIALLSAVPAGNMAAVLAAGTLVGGTLIGAQAMLYAIAPQCYPAEVRGTGVGFAVSVGRVGAVVGPLFAGFLLASGMGPQHLLYAILPIAAICGLATAILITRRARAMPIAA